MGLLWHKDRDYCYSDDKRYHTESAVLYYCYEVLYVLLYAVYAQWFTSEIDR